MVKVAQPPTTVRGVPPSPYSIAEDKLKRLKQANKALVRALQEAERGPAVFASFGLHVVVSRGASLSLFLCRRSGVPGFGFRSGVQGAVVCLASYLSNDRRAS